jgi:hypothetical protein
MKRFIPALVLVALVAITALGSLQAYVTPQQRDAGENLCMNTLTTQANHTATAATSLAWTTMVPATVLPPYRVEIQNNGAFGIRYGLGIPTATSTYLAASGTLTRIFNVAPTTLNIRALDGTTNVTVSVWK